MFFRAESFTQAGQWFACLAAAHGLGAPLTTETLALAALVAGCLVIVRGYPNSLEIPLERLGAVRQIALGAATATSVLLMNYGSKFLYFQF